MVMTFIDFQNETSFQTDVLRYSCSNFDYCEIDFLFKHIHWLIIDKYQPEFGNSILSLHHRGNISSIQFNFIFDIDTNFSFFFFTFYSMFYLFICIVSLSIFRSTCLFFFSSHICISLGSKT